MRRLALTLATAVLASGCIVGDDHVDHRVGDATLYWNFRNVDAQVAGDFGAANAGCVDAGVTEVDLELYRGSTRVLYQTYPCQESGTSLPRAGVGGLEEGEYGWRLTAYRIDEQVFTSEGGLVVVRDRNTDLRATLDVISPQSLTLYYTINGAFTCGNASSIYYSLLDTARTNVVSTGTIGCDPVASGFSISGLPVGANYYLDFLQALDSRGVALYERCGLALRHTGFPIVIDLGAAPQPACG
ncbi:hypothetical protein [Anaeromyxobacter terrae]|uniref:hypothetical protein n=1 Tax=Anaeromyxobacter terrae TaxID=2925406 RepID=UPI001F580BAA|nr:hypothetical protein [Anaeromyxobacter sp. SG22]